MAPFRIGNCQYLIQGFRMDTKLDIHAQHILSDGQLEGHEHALQRLLDNLKLRQLNMFRSFDDIIAEASRIQEDAIDCRVKMEGGRDGSDLMVTGTA